MNKLRLIYFIAVAVVVSLWLMWAVYASHFLPSGIFGPPATITIANLGAYGDTFGVVGSFMTSLAATAALIAFLRQQEDNRDQEFERNFFTLLNNLQIIVSEIDIVRYDASEHREARRKLKDRHRQELFMRSRLPLCPTIGRVSGRDALRLMLNQLRYEIGDASLFRDSKSINSIYSKIFNRRHDDLGHYFRTC